MTLFARALRLRSVVCACVGALLILASVSSAEAQRWSQRVQIITPVEEDGPAYAILDSIVTHLETKNQALRLEGEEVMIRRVSDGPRMSLRMLENELLEQGLGLVSATHVFIQYKFELVDDDFVETIEELTYIYRPPLAEQEDVRLFTLSTDHPELSRLMMESGLPTENNLNAINSFASLLSFPRIAPDEDTQVVRLGNRTIREDYAQQSQRLTAQLVEMVYDDAMPVTIRTQRAPDVE